MASASPDERVDFGVEMDEVDHRTNPLPLAPYYDYSNQLVNFTDANNTIPTNDTPKWFAHPSFMNPLISTDYVSGNDLVSPNAQITESDLGLYDSDPLSSPVDCRGPVKIVVSESQPFADIQPGKIANRRSGHATRLRTASRKPRRSSNRVTGATSSKTADGTDDGLTPEKRRARRSHNQVEKHYRYRLNSQFECLLAVSDIKQQQEVSPEGKGDDSRVTPASVEDKRISKAEVLDAAVNRIRELEREGRRLQQENKELIDNMELMSGVIATSQRA